MFLLLLLLLFGFALFIAQNVVASLPHCRCHCLCRPASSGNRVINAWNFHNRNEFPAPAASQARKHARNPLTIHHLTSPLISFYLLQAKLQSGDLATPLLLVVALITNASCWQKSSWPSCAKQTKTSLVPGVAAYRGEGKGRKVDSARAMARQAHALCEQVKRLTVRRRIGSERTEVEVGVRVKRSLVLAGRPIEGSSGGSGGELPGQAVVGLCLLSC